MKTLIIYDQTGYILSLQSGEPAPREPVGVAFLWVDVPNGKRVVSVDVSTVPHEPIYEDIPPTEIEILNSKVAEQAILELTMALAAIQGGNA